MSEKARLKVYADLVEPLLAGDGNALLNLASEYPFRHEMLLTAHDAEEGILLGLDAGADDYLSKRVSEAQLVARLSAATRVLSLEHSLKSALEDRRQLAMTDALTGTYNRRYFMRYLGGELKRSRRYRTDRDLAGAAVVAEKLRKSVEEMPVRLAGSVRSITVSIGVSGLRAMPKRDAAVEELLAHADGYLYVSKETGRNRVTIHDSNAVTP
jgi:PleD family two-component response regulator